MSSEGMQIVDNDRWAVLVDDNGATKHRVSFDGFVQYRPWRHHHCIWKLTHFHGFVPWVNVCLSIVSSIFLGDLYMAISTLSIMDSFFSSIYDVPFRYL